MKSLMLIFLILALCSQSLALGVEDFPVYKKYPKQHLQIQKYWRAFKGSARAPRDSGTHLAAQILLQEAEDELKNAELTDADMASLSESAVAALKWEEEEALKVHSRQDVLNLLEVVDTIPLKEMDLRMKDVLASRSEFVDAYKGGKKLNLALPAINNLAFRINTGFLLMAMAEAEGTDFSIESNAKSLNPTLKALAQFMNSTDEIQSVENQLLIMLAKLPPGKNLNSNLVKRWRALNPRDTSELLKRSVWRIQNSDYKVLHGVAAFIVFLGFTAMRSQDSLGGVILGAGFAAVGPFYLWVLRSFYKDEYFHHVQTKGERLLNSCFERMNKLKGRG